MALSTVTGRICSLAPGMARLLTNLLALTALGCKWICCGLFLAPPGRSGLAAVAGGGFGFGHRGGRVDGVLVGSAADVDSAAEPASAWRAVDAIGSAVACLAALTMAECMPSATWWVG